MGVVGRARGKGGGEPHFEAVAHQLHFEFNPRSSHCPYIKFSFAPLPPFED